MPLIPRLFKKNKGTKPQEEDAQKVDNDKKGVLFTGKRAKIYEARNLSIGKLTVRVPSELNSFIINDGEAVAFYSDDPADDAKRMTLSVNSATLKTRFVDVFADEVIKSIEAAGISSEIDSSNMLITCDDGRRIMFKECRGWIATMTYFNADESYISAIMDTVNVDRGNEPMSPGSIIKIKSVEEG